MTTPALATLADTKAALRIDDGDLLSDTDIERLIAVASEEVVAYLKRSVIEVITDPDTSPAGTETVMDLTASPPLIPARVTQATIMLVGYLYRSPDADPGKDWEQGYLPRPVMSLLHQLRDPALA
jgi:hypothetical protein